MDDRLEQKLERQIGGELRRLKDARAPRTLVPRVLAAIEPARPEAWWHRPWLAWPRTAQTSSAILLALAIGAVWYGLDALWVAFQGPEYVAQANRWFDGVALIADGLVTLGRALVMTGQSAGRQFMFYGLAVCLAMYAACVGFGTIFYRMVCPSRPRS